jgi:hypothetical protein
MLTCIHAKTIMDACALAHRNHNSNDANHQTLNRVMYQLLSFIFMAMQFLSRSESAFNLMECFMTRSYGDAVVAMSSLFLEWDRRLRRLEQANSD